MPEWKPWKHFTRKNIENEPKGDVVYNLKEEKKKGKKEPDYIGSTNNPPSRLKKHMRDPKKSGVTKYRTKEVDFLDSRKAAEGREGAKYAKKHPHSPKPKLNKRLPKKRGEFFGL